MMLAVLWRNPADNLDVNLDGVITPTDAVQIINDLNANGIRQLPSSKPTGTPFLDSQGDGNATPLDALYVVNHLNLQGSGPRTLVTSGRYDAFQEVAITTGAVPSGARIFRAEIESQLDASTSSRLVPDFFSVYVVDPQDRNSTMIDRGQKGSSIFTLYANGSSEIAMGITQWNGQVLEIDISSIAGTDTALLRLELVKANSESSSQIRWKPIDNIVDTQIQPGQFISDLSPVTDAGDAVDPAILNPTTTIEAILSSPRIDNLVGSFVSEFQVRNLGQATGRTIAMTFPNLPKGITIENASGFDPQGNPYLSLFPAIPEGGLGPQQESDRIRVVINNPNRQPLDLQPQLWAGPPNRAPILNAIGPQSAFPGARLAIPIEAVDPDGDTISYSVFAQDGSKLPNGKLDASGRSLTFEPTPADLGSYDVVIEASDGVLTGRQTFRLDVTKDPVISTRVSGRVLDVDGSPLASVQVEIGSIQVLTNRNGEFLLDLGQGPITSETIRVRGDLFSSLSSYPFIAEKLPFMMGHPVYQGYNNILHRPIYLPKLDVANGTTINPQIDNTVAPPTLPGISLQVAANSLWNQQGTPFTGILSITEVPTNRTPASLPAGVLPDMVVTIQPGEMVFTTPAPLTFPNRAGYPPGMLLNLMSINPATGEFDDVGDMKVSEDGTSIETIRGGVRTSSWHFPEPLPPTPRPSPQPEPAPDRCKATMGNFEVVCLSGEVRDSFETVPYKTLGGDTSIQLNYNSGNFYKSPKNLRLDFENLGGLSPQQSPRLEIIFEIVQNGIASPAIISSENSIFQNANTLAWDISFLQNISPLVTIDINNIPTSQFEIRSSSRITTNVNGNHSATRYVTQYHNLDIPSETPEGFGAGWGLKGLLKISRLSNGVTLTDGMGSTFFAKSQNKPNNFESTYDNFSRLSLSPENTFSRTLKDATVQIFDARDRLSKVIDPIGNTWRYDYGPSGIIASITDPTGLKTSFQADGKNITTITDPFGRKTLLTYNDKNNLVQITSPDGTHERWTYNTRHQVTSHTNKNGATEKIFYSQSGIPIYGIRKDGTKQTYLQPRKIPGTNSFGSSYIGPDGNNVITTLSDAGIATEKRDSLGIIETMQRNRIGQISEITNGRGDTSHFVYDANGNAKQISWDTYVETQPLQFPGEMTEIEAQTLATATADMDGDGHIDLLLTHPNSVSILLGKGDATFKSPQTFPAGSRPNSIAIGDINSDGFLDVLTANSDSNDVSVLLGHGNGNFEPQTTIPVGNQPNSIDLGDINDDGFLDFYTTEMGGRTVSLAFGNGDGSFTSPNKVSTGVSTGKAMLTDSNNDSYLDIIILNTTRDNITVILGTGNGTFAAVGKNYTTGDDPYSLALADVNNDEKPDIITSNSSYTISVLIGNGDGSFQQKIDSEIWRLPENIKLNDIDLDGNFDALVTFKSADNLEILRGDGTGRFAAFKFILHNKPNAIEIADFNGDGYHDIFSLNSDEGTFYSVVKGLKNGDFSKAPKLEIGDTENIIVADLNNDGLEDIVATSRFGTSVLIKTQNGFFADTQNLPHGGDSIAMGDFDHDGMPDLVTSLSFNNMLHLYAGNGDGTFTPKTSLDVGDGAIPSNLKIADLNGDGNIDIVTANYGNDSISAFWGKGDSTFADPESYPVGSGPYSVSLADIDGDGKLDIATANFIGGDISFLKGYGDGRFGEQAILPAVRESRQLEAFDINRDSRMDLLVLGSGDDGGDVISVALGNDNQGFNDPYIIRLPFRGDSFSIKDIDQDEFADIVAPNMLGVSLIRGFDNGQFSQARTYIPHGTISFSDVAICDVNQDGLFDFVIGSESGVAFLYQEDSIFKSILKRSILVSNTIYDPIFNTPVEQFDANNHRRIYTVDTRNGNRTSERQVIGLDDTLLNGQSDDLVSSYTYTDFGLLDTVTDPLGRITDYDYDSLGRLISIKQAVGTSIESVERYEYDSYGNTTAKVDALGNRTTMEYDVSNRLTRYTSPDPDGTGPLTPASTTFEYDALGQVVRMVDATGLQTSRTYDSMGRILEDASDADRTTRKQYDLAGNLVSFIDASGNTTRYKYDARNRVSQSVASNGGVTKYFYDLANNLTSLVDPNGHRTQFRYDSRARLTEEIDPLGQRILYKYDNVGNLITKTDRSGRTRSFEYDDVNRLIKETWRNSDGSTANAIQYSYDKVGNLLSIEDWFSKLTQTYDELDRVVSVTNQGTPNAPIVELDYAYDAVGNVTSMTDVVFGVVGATTNYSYDGLNRLTNVAQSGDGADPKLIDLVYNELGQYSAIDRYSDLERRTLDAHSTFTYDESNRLSSLSHGSATDPRSFSYYDFLYDASDRVASISDTAGGSDYRYDATGQLTRVTRGQEDLRGSESYSYDKNGNRLRSHLAAAYTTSGANRLVSDGTYNYEYDSEGNVTRRSEIASGQTREFAWDHRNRLVRVTDKTASGIVIQEVGFVYDALDRRIAKTVDPDGAGPLTTSTLHFIYDIEDVLFDFASSQTAPDVYLLNQRYLHGPGIDNVLAQESPGRGTDWLLLDHLGTPGALLNTNTNLVQRQFLDSFGNPSIPSAELSRYGFTGREQDSETGLIYYRSRYYDPKLGQFLSEDSIGILGGDSNLKRYVSNSPINSTDPSGRWIESAIDAALIASDLIDIAANWDNPGKRNEAIGSALGNAVGLMIPGVTGLGAVGKKLANTFGSHIAEEASRFVADKLSGCAYKYDQSGLIGPLAGGVYKSNAIREANRKLQKSAIDRMFEAYHKNDLRSQLRFDKLHSAIERNGQVTGEVGKQIAREAGLLEKGISAVKKLFGDD